MEPLKPSKFNRYSIIHQGQFPPPFFKEGARGWLLKASALYLAVTVSVIIALITGTLITTAYFYRAEYQKSDRYKQLLANLESATEMALADSLLYDETRLVDLYGDGRDSILFSKKGWGVFELAVIRSYRLADTLKKAFLTGTDTRADLTALYLTDEDRPVSVSGRTEIRGEAALPGAGIRKAYVEGKAYTGKELVYGPVRASEKTLPLLDAGILERITQAGNDHSAYPEAVTGSRSFYETEQKYYAGEELKDISVKGHIVLFSDTVLKISKSARLEDIIIYAPAVIIEEGFRGSCQVFAADSIVTGSNAVFYYPSCLGILKKEGGQTAQQPEIRLGLKNTFNGILFTNEKQKSTFQTLISIGKDSKVNGEIYASGFVKLDQPVQIRGKLAANRLFIKTPSALYENYLIDISIDRQKRNPDYLSSALLPSPHHRREVLKWLD